jgi:transposase-like protein
MTPEELQRAKIVSRIRGGAGLARVARELDVTVATLRGWVEQAETHDTEDEARRQLDILERTAGWNPRAGRRDPKKRRPIP